MDEVILDAFPLPSLLRDKPLLTACVMVKDEKDQIERTLRSCEDVVDNVVVLDTGSTDGTQRLINNLDYKVPIYLYEESFIDFATSRNRLLDFARPKGKFLLLMDANDELKDAHYLRENLKENPNVDMFILRYIILNDVNPGRRDAFFRHLVIRGGCRSISYRYPIHEELNWDSKSVKHASLEKAEVYMFQDRAKDKSSSNRFERDEKILKDALKRNPDNVRLNYYLGQTYCCLKDIESAIKHYRKVLEVMGGSNEYVEFIFWTFIHYISAYIRYNEERIENGDLSQTETEEIEGIFDILFYYTREMERMEAYYFYAHYWLMKKDYQNAYINIVEAIKFPYPTHYQVIIQEGLYEERWKVYANIVNTILNDPDITLVEW